jgi:hypothetical protein
VNGPQFLISKIAGYQDQQKKALLEAQTNAAREHGGYYAAMAKLAGQRGEAVGMNAETRRLKALGDISDRWGDRIPDKAEWEQEGQNGGLLHTAFGGPIPYEKAPLVLAQSRQEFQRQFEPDATEKQLGITREHKLQAYKDRYLADLYGAEPKSLINKGVRLTPSGDFAPRLGSNTAGERTTEVIARTGLQRLDEGEKMLTGKGTFKQFFGDTEPGLTGKNGLTGIGEAGEGFRNVKAAILDLNFALSGKSVSNKEREEFLNLYMPRWNDSAATQKQKMRMVREYFQQVLKMRNSGATDEQVKERFDQALRDGERLEVDVPRKGTGGWRIEKVE